MLGGTDKERGEGEREMGRDEEMKRKEGGKRKSWGEGR